MCGICGKIDLFGTPVDKASIRRMCDAMALRGPDDSGLYLSDHPEGEVQVGFGHRRLSIIDLSAAARQPMSNEDGTVWITYNGEIYNYRELRNRLAAQGHRFRSDSDTEVVLHLYEEQGPDAVLELNGMFAFGSGTPGAGASGCAAIASASNLWSTSGTVRRCGSPRKSRRC